MPPRGDLSPDESARPISSSGLAQAGRSAPLVIVSERGRHSDESRRIVRAQAARASAAQSRVTRARNREGKEGSVREEPQSPGNRDASTPVEPLISESTPSSSGDTTGRPIVTWLASTLNLSPSGLIENVGKFTTASPPVLGGVTSLVSSGLGSIGSALGSVATFGQTSSDSGRPQLPRAVPRGFAILQQRVQIADGFVSLISRTACFDFGSPGVEERLNQLLYDLIMSHLRSILSPLPGQGHPIQGHLRLACTCLTIFQGQRANGVVLPDEGKYQSGLEAAWSEAVLLDQGSLTEPKSAEASLWAVFIISVTTGFTTVFFHQLLNSLLQDLQLRYWSQVRSLLLEFIYPVSFLDAPCKLFFENLKQLQIGLT